MDPTSEQTRAQLERILASAGFATTDRLSRFLRYVVERSLAGEADQLKEYVIGRDVFDRDEQYDPRLDSIVRVEAGRLRTKLDEYYNGPGRADALVIHLRRGSYAPVFESRQPASQDDSIPAREPARPPVRRSRWRLGVGLLAATFGIAAVLVWRAGIWATAERPAPTHTIAVLPFSNYSSDPSEPLLTARLTDGVTGELARLRTLGVVSHTSAQQYAGARKPLREIARALDADLILEGTVTREGERLRIQVRLVDATIDRKLWVEDFSGTASELPDVQRQIARAVTAAALGPSRR
jgi:adenylate cyclase